MVKAKANSTNVTFPSQMSPGELTALADACGTVPTSSCRNCPHQQADLWAAAKVID
jgi:hypothetical protein